MGSGVEKWRNGKSLVPQDLAALAHGTVGLGGRKLLCSACFVPLEELWL